LSESDRFSKTLNTKYHEGPACFTHLSNKIIFTRNNFNNGKYKQSADGINKLKLYTADENGGNWSNVQEIPFNSDEYSTGHPTISKDDKTVYFASDMPGGFGGTDIYSVEYNNGSWGTPRNLGKSVNSKGNEMFPFVDDNGNLYYSSDGLAGLGDLDVFFVQIQNGNAIGKPSNLGEPINSNKDDFGIITDGQRKSGYLSSNRKRGGIDDDIYRFTREGSLYPCRELSVFVFDADTKMPLDSVSANVTLKDGSAEVKNIDENNGLKFCVEEKQEYTFKTVRRGYAASTVGYAAKGDLKDDQPSRLEIALSKLLPPPPVIIETKPVVVQEPVVRNVNKLSSKTKLKGIATLLKDNSIMEGATVTVTNECDGSVQQMITGADGAYEFELTSGCDYSLEYFKEDYIVGKVKIEKSVIKKSPKVLVKDLGLLRQGDEITIDNIYYDLNQWYIRTDAAKELDKLIITLKRYPTMVVELGSHTDSRGDAGDNKVLSQKRAQAATDYLAKKGIERKRLVASGYGESQLINQCADGITCTEAEHQKNRRTTLRILRLN
jgi:outer membrane protein OmpA-like peptidoglycan-associated protein